MKWNRQIFNAYVKVVGNEKIKLDLFKWNSDKPKAIEVSPNIESKIQVVTNSKGICQIRKVK